jgi:hypothetical protein
MPIIANARAAEIPWRPGYRRFTLAGTEQGVGCSVSYSVLEPGAGAPLHRHDDLDEVLIVPHAFVAVGTSPVRFFAFLPKQGAAAATTYLDGDPPLGADRR